MPVLELSSCDEHERIVSIGLLRRGNYLGGAELGLAGSRREILDEDDALARVAFLLAGISHGGFALEPLPRDACDRRHRSAHFREDVARMRVSPVEPE